jgi:predicted dehydrogenase
MEPAEKSRVGVFGAGYWATLAEAATRWLPEIEIDRVWSRTPDRAADLAAKIGCRVARGLDDVADLDLAVVGLPPVAMPEVAMACLTHRVRCLLEKPVALDAASIEKVAARFKDAGLPAAVNLQGRFVPAMHAVRAAVASGQYGRLLEVDVAALGNRGCTASKLPHSWLNLREEGGGVVGISGPHAAEFLLALAGAGETVFARAWMEVPERADTAGTMQPCTANDNLEVITEHDAKVRGRLRVSTTARKEEESWSARCEGGTLRVGADDRPVLVENFGETTALPCERIDVLQAVGLADHAGLNECPDPVFPALVLLALFVRGDESVPDLDLMARCMAILAP